MSLVSILYVVGLAFVFAGERLLSGYDGWRALLDAAGVSALVAAGVVLFRRYRTEQDPGRRFGMRVALASLLGAAVGLVLYAGTTDTVTKALGLSPESLSRYRGVVGALYPMVLLVVSVPFVALDVAVRRNPVVMPMAQVRHVLVAALTAGLGAAWVVPLDYIAARRNHRIDLTRFKTTGAGTATRNIAAALETPLNVRIFLPPASDVEEELLGYFSQIEGPNLTVEVMDLAAHPRLARALRVRENGVVAITKGEVRLDEEGVDVTVKSRPVTRTIRVGTRLDEAKRTLRKLDGEVQKILLELGQSERVAYFTTGHGELGWKGNRPPDESLKGLRKVLEALHFRVETLSLASGLGDTVPEDADLLVVAGPREAFHPAEQAAISAYLERGGALLVALEPARARGLDKLLDLPAPGSVARPSAPPKAGDADGAEKEGAGAAAGDPAGIDKSAAERRTGKTEAVTGEGAGNEPALVKKVGGAPEGLKGTSEEDPLAQLVASLGVKMGRGVLAAEGGYVPIWHGKLDRTNLVTDRFSVHPSTTVMAEFAGRLLLFTPTSGYLERVDAPKRKVVFTVRSLPIAWADLDGNLAFDADRGEAKRERPLVAAAEPKEAGATPFRAVVAADATFLSDLALGNLGNQQFIVDTVNWLIGAEALSGRTETEEDVKIEHTKEDQAKWFYATVLGVPVLVLVLGAVRVRRRRRGEDR